MVSPKSPINIIIQVDGSGIGGVGGVIGGVIGGYNGNGIPYHASFTGLYKIGVYRSGISADTGAGGSVYVGVIISGL